MRRVRLFQMAGLGVLLTVSCALAGCGDSDKAQNGVASGSGNGAAAGASAIASASPDLAKWTKCLRDNGVDVKDPEPGGGITLPMDSPATKQALEKCKQYEGGARGSTGFDPNDPKQQEQQRKFAKCMRDKGVDWPDPDPNSQTIEAPKLTPQMGEALEMCAKETQDGSK
ncbi:hypothetical protein [Dactylosporangium sp. NPDC048998]|uniref:hypothetical protein n=1 Tax=Dactylosporangium sp. NPDC048998 TaxID=3363976 RepID=UPI003713DE41